METKELNVIKIGGNVIDNPDALEHFVTLFSETKGAKILVHGGGKLATQMAEQLNIPTKMVDGRRVTDAATLRIVTMVYAGYINKNIVAKLQANGVNAIGLSGADGNLIPATKRPVTDIDYGFVGDVNAGEVNSTLLNNLLEQGICPVICSITHDKQGQLLNTNADTIAKSIASAMAPYHDVTLTFCFEKEGVICNGEVLPKIDKELYAKLKAEGIVNGGMVPKLDNAFSALECGVKMVNIKQASMLGTTNCGTTLTL